MLGEDYITIDGIKMTPATFDYSFNPIENTSQSEAGTDLTAVTRLDKKVFNLSWSAIDSKLLDVIESICLKPYVIVIFRDKEYRCRARGFAPKLVTKSYKYRHSDGLWDIAINLTEI